MNRSLVKTNARIREEQGGRASDKFTKMSSLDAAKRAVIRQKRERIKVKLVNEAIESTK